MSRGDKAHVRLYLHPMYTVENVYIDDSGLPEGCVRIAFIAIRHQRKKPTRKAKKK